MNRGHFEETNNFLIPDAAFPTRAYYHIKTTWLSTAALRGATAVKKKGVHRAKTDSLVCKPVRSGNDTAACR
jgi:hypothetical protein